MTSYKLWGENDPPPYRYATDETNSSRGKSEDGDTSSEDSEDRGQWGNKAEFLLSCIGLSVGLGNVWRFPVLAYENGGAAFLIPYVILQLVIGKPMYFMELAMGQYSGKGPTSCWSINPSGKGIGIAMLMISIIVAIYYNVIMAYCVYYFAATMQESLPWNYCKEEWVRDYQCVVRGGTGEGNGLMKCTSDYFKNDNNTYSCICVSDDASTHDNDSMVNYNLTSDCYRDASADLLSWDNFLPGACDRLCISNATPAAELYFYKDVIQLSDTLEPGDIGAPIWYLVLCLAFSWIVVVLCLIKGIKSSGKVVYFTATFPYVILIILLIRGALEDGALEGVLYFLVPEWSKLLDLGVWQAAASQMFFSLSVSFGGIIMFGSYNRFKNNVYIDSLIISVMDIVTSIIAGFVIFTTLGAMSKELNVPIEDVAKKGYGLAFVAYPEALSRLPVPHLWSLLFFFMLFTLGLDSEFALIETVLTCIQDEFPKMRRHKWKLCVISGCICFLLALPCVTKGGDYLVTLLDTYGASYSVLFVAGCELVAVMWVYRVDRFMKDIKYMMGYNPHPWPYWAFCWVFVAPVLVWLLLGYTFALHAAPTYADGTPFPPWVQAVGWIISAMVMLPVPIWFIFELARAEGDNIIQRLKYTVTPRGWVPQDGSKPEFGRSTDELTTYPIERPVSYDNPAAEKY